jgi:hypothetical protein
MKIEKIHNKPAADWAKKHTGEAYPNFSRKQKKCLQDAVVSFYVDGLNLGQAAKLLEKEFSKESSTVLIGTEITRASAYGEIEQAREIQKGSSTIKMLKEWQTENDDFVCPRCASLKGKRVPIEGYFDDEKKIFAPPCEAGCRCWINLAPEGW